MKGNSVPWGPSKPPRLFLFFFFALMLGALLLDHSAFGASGPPKNLVTAPPDKVRAAALGDLRAGFTALRLGDRRIALKHFDRSIDSGKLNDDELATAYSLRGKARRRLRDFDGAVADYTRAIKIIIRRSEKDRLAVTYADRGLVNYYQGQYEKALADYHKSLQLIPNMPQTHYRMANVLRVQGRFTQAVESYTKAISLQPDHSYYYGRSIAYERMGQTKEALADVQKAVKLKPERRKYRARLYFLKSKIKD